MDQLGFIPVRGPVGRSVEVGVELGEGGAAVEVLTRGLDKEGVAGEREDATGYRGLRHG